MKKVFCLFITLMLIVSIFSTVAIAFAEENSESETPARTLTYNKDAFLALEEIQTISRVNKKSKFSLNNEWLKDVAKVKAVFGDNINYTLKEWAEDAENKDELAVAEGSDRFSIEYCTPSKDYKQTWLSTGDIKESTTINIDTVGWWAFRYIVKDSKGVILARTDRIDVYFGDETPPVITGLSTAMDKIEKDDETGGLKVGEKYTIKTDVKVDKTSTTVTYVVYKWVNGAWTTEPIYDSKTKELAEGFEEGFNAEKGEITILKSDVLPGNQAIYKIVYQATDNLGYVSNTKDFLIRAVAVEEQKMSATDIWKIVLYVIAGLSAVGIVVVLCIKPKETTSTDEVAR